MKVNSYLLADKSQMVEPPIPVEPVAASVADSSYIITYHMLNENISAEKTFTNNRNTQKQWDTSSGEYYVSQGYDCVPCNFGGSSSGTEVTLYPDATLNNYYTECHVLDQKGSFTLTVGSLPPGNYCFEITGWIGSHGIGYQGDGTTPNSVVEVVGSKGAVVTAGEHGAIEGRIYPQVVRYPGANISQYQEPYYLGRVIMYRFRYAFTIESGDTTKVFKFGTGEAISLSDLCGSVKIYDQPSAGVKGSVWCNTEFSFNIKVYTAR